MCIFTNIVFSDSFLFHIKNDFINDTDRHLTNTMTFSWVFDKNKTKYYDTFNFQIKHDIFTPENLKSKNKEDYDLPYAGSIDTIYKFYKFDYRFYHSLGFIIGHIGKHAYAKEIQSGLHSVISATKPQGWDNQIGPKNKIGIVYEFGHRLYEKELNFNKFEFLYHFHTEYSSTIRDIQTIFSFRYGDGFPSNFVNPQLNLQVAKGWDISYNFKYVYSDYIYILDEYKDEYNINRDKNIVQELVNFNYYNKDEVYSLNLTQAKIFFNNKDEYNRWLGLTYTYIFD